MTQGESFVRPYVQELRLSLRNNVGAYGYSVMITCCLSMLSARLHTPQPGELFWFIIGAVASFGLIEAIATRGFQRPLASGEPTQVVALGSALNLFAIVIAMFATLAAAAWVAEPLAWAVGSFGASVVYLIGTSIEMSIARKIEDKRGLR